MKIKFTFFTFLCFILFSFNAFAYSPKTGFLTDSVWFSEDEVFLNQKIKIYTTLFNGESSDIKIHLNFVNNDIPLEKKEINLIPNESKTVFIEWKVALGQNEIYVEIIEVKIGNDDIVLSNKRTKKTRFTISENTLTSLSGQTITEEFLGFIKEDGKKDKVESWFNRSFEKTEEFRVKYLNLFEESKDKIQKKKEKNKDSSSAVKGVTFVHLVLLALVSFIFSVKIIFYVVGFILAFSILKLIFNILKKIFRKDYE